ncbi:MAG TPA: PilZ domain-containing protein [Myxococcota bacterium]|jgi:hypothetical protein|nr:PilZ domain-containing protein [Myxococcota bacterium]
MSDDAQDKDPPVELPREHGEKRRQRADVPPAGDERRQGDRRLDPRVKIEVWVEERRDDREVYYLRTADISAGGAFIEGSIPYGPGTRMQLHIPLPGFVPFVVQAEVVSSGDDRGQLGMGVKFIDPAFDLVAAVKSLS